MPNSRIYLHQHKTNKLTITDNEIQSLDPHQTKLTNWQFVHSPVPISEHNKNTKPNKTPDRQ